MLHQSPHGAPDTCHGGFRLFRAAQEAGVLLNAQHKRTQTKMQPRRGPYGPAGAAELQGMKSGGAAARCPARRGAGNMLCCRLLRALHTTHACMLPASAQPEPFFSCTVRHAQTKTAPAKGCMARRGCAAAGHEKLRGSRAGHAPQRFMR